MTYFRRNRSLATIAVSALILVLGIRLHANAASPSPAATQPSYTLSGTITDDQGRPIADAFVGPAGDNLWYGATTDGDGRFQIKDVHHDRTQFFVWSERRVLMTAFATDPTSKDVGHIPLDCVPMDVEGRVVNSAGLPIEKAHVDVHLVGPDNKEYVVKTDDFYQTDPSGRYTIGAIPARPGFSVWVSLRGQNQRTPSIAIGRQYQVEMPDLVSATMTPAAKPGPVYVRYSGRILDEQTRQPLAGVKVEILYLTVVMNEIGTVLTDADGTWSCLGPPDVSKIQINLERSDYISSAFSEGRYVTPPISELRDGTAVQYMKRGLQISGNVLGPNGKPVWNALVLAGENYASTGGTNEAIEDSTAAHTDRDGSFTIGGLPPGKRQLVITADGMAPDFVRFQLTPQTSPIITRMRSGHTMRGRVIDENGQPIEGARVHVGRWTMTDAYSRPLPQSVHSDADGRFALTDLPGDGLLQLIAKREARMIALFEVAASTDDIGDITLCLTTHIKGSVVDAVTGKLINNITARVGCVMDDGRIVYSGLDSPQHCKDETFDICPNWIIDRNGTTQFCAEITAIGYAPQVTSFVTARKPSRPMIVRLEPSPSVAGVVVDTQNSPVKNADVIWVRPNNNVGIIGAKIDLNYSYAPDIQTTTGADGKFKLPRPFEPGRILVLGDAGYALLNSNDYRPDRPLQLTPWSRIEGTYSPGGRPRAGTAISLTVPNISGDPTKRDRLSFELNTTTDVSGHFALDHVPSLPLRVEALANFGPASFGDILTPPGQSLHLDLGRNGSPVTGKIDLSQVVAANPPADGEKFDTSTSWIRAFRIDPLPRMPAGADPADWNSQMGAVLDGTATENSPIPAYFADLQPDGSFSFVDLPPGKYELIAVIHGERPANTCGWGLVLARGHRPFTVAHDPVELPTLSPDVIAHPSVGSIAPEITGKDATGKNFILSSLHGKYIVLDFWAGWCGPCRASLPLLQAVYRKHESANVAFVGLNFDYTTTAAMSAIRSAATPWPNILLGPWDGNSPALQSYDVSILPSLYLIGPDGRIAARDPTLDQLDALLPKNP